MAHRLSLDNRRDMSLSTSGIAPRTGSRALRDAVELLSSMRFAISLLSLICIASVIGTVVLEIVAAGTVADGPVGG